MYRYMYVYVRVYIYIYIYIYISFRTKRGVGSRPPEKQLSEAPVQTSDRQMAVCRFRGGAVTHHGCSILAIINSYMLLIAIMNSYYE